MKILIAEDDKVSSEYLYKVLSLYGRCDVVINGIEAVDAFMLAIEEGEPYELVCLDLMMPLFDGEKVLKTIRSLEKSRNIGENGRARVFITSALDDDELTGRLDQQGFDRYFIKPIDTDMLINSVKEIFDR